MSTLILVESPTKAATIASYLGSGYTVLANYGPFMTLDGLQNIEHHFTNPIYKLVEDPIKQRQLEKIRVAISTVSDVVLAMDNDCEGELLAYHLCQHFGLSVIHTKRIVFYEISKKAIEIALAFPKQIDMNKVHNQITRQTLDLLVCFIVSPFLWSNISKPINSSLSAGRCQTPCLRLLYDHFLIHKESTEKLVYHTIGYFFDRTLPFLLDKVFESSEETKDFLEACKICDSFLFKVAPPKKSIKKQPEPFTTASLLQEALNNLHLSPKEVMKCAQELYEHGYITYMKTNSKKYSNKFLQLAKQFILTTYGDEFVSISIDQLELLENLEKKEEAIRPVNLHIRSIPEKEDLSKKTVKLYALIWARTVESCMSPAQYSVITATISAPLGHHFAHQAEQPVFLGWQKIADPGKNTDSASAYAYLQALSLGSSKRKIHPKKIVSSFSFTCDIPLHYTEPTLIQQLEEKGIGCPSTFATLVDKIQTRKYVEKQTIFGQKKAGIDFSLEDEAIKAVDTVREFGGQREALVLQPLGIDVIEFLLSKFGPIFEYDYLENLEKEMASDSETAVVARVYADLQALTATMPAKEQLIIDEDHTLVVGKYGLVVKCSDGRFLPVKKGIEMDTAAGLSLEEIVYTDTATPIGKYQGKDLFVRKGKFGLYAQWGKETKSLKEADLPVPIRYIDVVKFLERDGFLLDPSKPVGLVRELNAHLSIRSGKYGDYVFYKKRTMDKPQFFKLSGFQGGNPRKCDKELLINWIKQTYKIY